jgi:hypothetical protein
MATLDSIQIAVDSLTSSTTTLLNEVTVSKTTLTNSRDAAQAAQAGAETAQTGAQTAQTAAEVAQAAAELALDTFDDRFLGAKEVAPTLDNDGNALLTGAIYWDTAETAMKVWTGSIWKFVTTAVEGVNDKTEFTGIASQTVLTISYDIGLVQVLYNGVLLAAADYTATNGTSITLTAAVTDNADVITVIRWGAVTTSTFLGTAATKNTGTATGEIPLNSDLTALFAAKAPLASPSFTGNASFVEVTETVHTMTSALIDAANGTMQKRTMADNETLTFTLAAGQSVYVTIVPAAFTLTLTNVTEWTGGAAPTTIEAEHGFVFWSDDGVTVSGHSVGGIA